jgi:hypothetical protein
MLAVVEVNGKGGGAYWYTAIAYLSDAQHSLPVLL